MSYVVEYPGGGMVFALKPSLVERMFAVHDPRTRISCTASSWSGRAMLSNARPPVNPWRHAYVRAKHFRRAAQRFDCAAIDWEWTHGKAKDYPGSSSILMHDWAHTLYEAARNADWGCR